jgi:FtsZ-binding cell division protein ZapB
MGADAGTDVMVADIATLDAKLKNAVEMLTALQTRVDLFKYRETAFGAAEPLERAVEGVRRDIRDVRSEFRARERVEQEQASKQAEALGPEGRARVRELFTRLENHVRRAGLGDIADAMMVIRSAAGGGPSSNGAVADIAALEGKIKNAVEMLAALQTRITIWKYRGTAFGLPGSSTLKALEAAEQLERVVEEVQRDIKDLRAEVRARERLDQEQARKAAEAIGPEMRARVREVSRRLYRRLFPERDEEIADAIARSAAGDQRGDPPSEV